MTRSSLLSAQLMFLLFLLFDDDQDSDWIILSFWWTIMIIHFSCSFVSDDKAIMIELYSLWFFFFLFLSFFSLPSYNQRGIHSFMDSNRYSHKTILPDDCDDLKKYSLRIYSIWNKVRFCLEIWFNWAYEWRFVCLSSVPCY